ncbi:hypothetical protein D3C73_1461990 [compost metagenome]
MVRRFVKENPVALSHHQLAEPDLRLLSPAEHVQRTGNVLILQAAAGQMRAHLMLIQA